MRFESLVTSAEIYQNFEYDATDLQIDNYFKRKSVKYTYGLKELMKGNNIEPIRGK